MLSFPPAKRLLTAKDFDPVFKQCQRRFHNRGFTYLTRPNNLNHSRIGFVLAKKKIKRAVGRNKVRRQHREIFRIMQQQWAPCDIVVLAKNQADKYTKPELTTMIEESFTAISRAYPLVTKPFVTEPLN